MVFLINPPSMWTCCTSPFDFAGLHQTLPINPFEGKLHNLCDLDTSRSIKHRTIGVYCIYNSNSKTLSKLSTGAAQVPSALQGNFLLCLSLPKEEMFNHLSWSVFVCLCLSLNVFGCLCLSLSVFAQRGDVSSPEFRPLVPVRAVLRLFLNLLTDLPHLSNLKWYFLRLKIWPRNLCGGI